MNDSSWGAPPRAGYWGRPTGDLSRGMPRRVPRTMRLRPQQTRPMPIVPDVPGAWRRRPGRRPGGRADGRPPVPRPRRRRPAAPAGRDAARRRHAHAPHAPQPGRRRRSARAVTCGAAIGVGVGLGAVIVASLFFYKPVFLGVIAVAVVVGLWELTSRLQERKDIQAPAGAARGRRRRHGRRRVRTRAPRARGWPWRSPRSPCWSGG